jgi:hypothetical protein
MNHKLQAKSYELWATIEATNYKLEATSFEIQVTSYELKSGTCQILPSDDSTVKDWTVVWLYNAKLYRTLIEFSCPGWFAPADDCIVQALKSLAGRS